MLKLSGALSIRTIHGRNGPFNVGNLVTEIGEFSIKDTVLDQYEEGRYEGDFGISRIYPSYYSAGGRLVVEVRATLQTIALVDIDELSEEEREPASEPDPILEQRSETSASPPQADTGGQTEADEQPGDPDAALFGALWPIGSEVKLDPTVDRARFRAQKDRLKELGYQFQPVGQIWTRSSDA